jgi:hypothetical protein
LANPPLRPLFEVIVGSHGATSESKSTGAGMTLPHDLKRIRLNLARSKEFPSGSAQHGYEFVAPLDGQGHIEAQLWQKYRTHCGVRRFWGREESFGHLVHKPGGAEHARWAFHYDPAPDEEEAGFRFGSHIFAPGEYVSIRDHGKDETHTFKVVSVERAT